jgi:acyl-coenzyme A thioesterase PaaI-like protein
MTKLLSLLLGTFLFAAPLAHAGAGHDHGPKHGGVVHEVGDIAGELVVKADSMTLHLLDHDKPLPTTGVKAEATVHSGGGKMAVTLAPAGDNKLAAQGSFKTGVGVRVAVVVSLADKREAKLNFRLK